MMIWESIPNQYLDPLGVFNACYVSPCEDNTLGYATLREQQVLPFPSSPRIHTVITPGLEVSTEGAFWDQKVYTL